MSVLRRAGAATGILVAALVACSAVPAVAGAQAVLPPVVQSSFSQDAATPGADVGLGFTVSNPNSEPTVLTGVGFDVSLPAGLHISTPSQLETTCDGSVTAIAGGSTIAVSGSTLQPVAEESSNSCSVVVDVVAPAPGVVSVAAGAPTSTNGGTGVPSPSASLRVLALPSMAESFDRASIRTGETARLTYAMSNPNAADRLYGLAFDDALPAGLAVAPTPNVTATCTTDGVLADPGATTISLLGLQVEPSSQCAFSLDVTGTAATNSANSSGPLSFSYDAGGGDLRVGTAPGASATLVVIAPPALTVAFGASSIVSGASTTLTFTVANTNPALGLSGVGFTAALSAGLVVSAPAGVSGSCGGGVTASAGSGSIALGAGTLAPSASCAISVGVTAQSAGAKTATTSAVSSSEAGSGAAASAVLAVTATPPPPPPPPPSAPKPPSNAFKVAKARVAKDGTVRFDVTVAGRGEVFVLEKLQAWRAGARTPILFTIARKTLRPRNGGTLHVKVTPSARGKRALKRSVRARVKLQVSFRPAGGRAGAAVRKTLIVRRR